MLHVGQKQKLFYGFIRESFLKKICKSYKNGVFFSKFEVFQAVSSLYGLMPFG